MLLVIIGHTTWDLTGIWNTSFVYGFHLVMFFLLSGYTSRPKTLTREFINQRFKRLMIPYFVTCAAILFMDIYNAKTLYNDLSILNISKIAGKDLLRIFFASGGFTSFGSIDIGTRIGAIWFLPALFFATLMFQMVISLTMDSDVHAGFISAMIAIGGLLSARFIWFPFSIQSAALAVPFIWMGYFIRKENLLDRLKWYHFIVAQIILLYGIYAGYCDIGFVGASISDPLLSIPVGLSGCLLIYLLTNFCKGKCLLYIGRESMTILCTHLFILETFWDYIQRWLISFHLSGNSLVWARCLLNILLSIFFAVITKWIIKVYHYVCNKLITHTHTHTHTFAQRMEDASL